MNKRKRVISILLCFALFISAFSCLTCAESFAAESNNITYKIRFLRNGGDTGDMTDMTCVSGQKYKLTKNAFERNKQEFYGWVVSRNDGKKLYSKSPGSSDPQAKWFTAGEQPDGYARMVFTDEYEFSNLASKNGAVVTCSALWRPVIDDGANQNYYYIHFEANGGSGRNGDLSKQGNEIAVEYISGDNKETVYAPVCGFKNPGKRFRAWRVFCYDKNHGQWYFNKSGTNTSYFDYNDDNVKNFGGLAEFKAGDVLPKLSGKSRDIVTFYAMWDDEPTADDDPTSEDEPRVIFHSNLPSNSTEDLTEGSTEGSAGTATNDYFKIYYANNTEGVDDNTANPDGTIESFDDIPRVKGYAFKGWYKDSGNNDDNNPISWNDVYDFSRKENSENVTHIYAHWLKVKDTTDPEQPAGYGDFDLLGVQLRQETPASEGVSKQESGLRFLAVLQESFINSLDSLYTDNDNVKNVKYGFLAVNTDTLNDNLNDGDYIVLDVVLDGVAKQFECTSSVNGTIAAAQRITRDHRNTDTYRLYTFVITYKDGNLKEKAFTARAYVQYIDANGLDRYYYNTYTGNALNHGGCSISYNKASEILKQM